MPETRFLSEHPLRKGRLEGWKHTQEAETRHRHLEEAIRKHGARSTEDALGALAVANKNKDPTISRIAREDEHWISRRNEEERHRESRREMGRE